MITGLRFMIVYDLFLIDEDVSATVTVTRTVIKMFILKHMMYLWLVGYCIPFLDLFCSGGYDCGCPVSVSVSVFGFGAVKLRKPCCHYKLL